MALVKRVTVDLSAVPANLTGVGRYATEMLAAMAPAASEAGIEIVAVTRKGDGARFQRRIPDLRVAQRVPLSRPARLAFEQVGMRGVLNEVSSDLHHGIHYTLPARLSQKSVVTIHDATLLEHPEWHERSKVYFFRQMIRHAAKVADGLIFPSNAALEGFRRHFESAAETKVIPHGVSAERFAAPDGVADSELLEGVGVSGRYFIFCGTLEPRKNLARLLNAFETLGDAQVQLILAGMTGWGNGPIAAQLARMIADKRAKVLGYVSDVELGALYRNACAALYPSLEEGFGLPGLEAMSQRCLLITSQHSAMAEYAGGSALLIDPLDDHSIAAAMRTALNPGAETMALADSGSKVAANMTWRNSANGHLDFYRSILGV